MDNVYLYRMTVIALLALIVWLLMIACDQLAQLRAPIRMVYVRDDTELDREA